VAGTGALSAGIGLVARLQKLVVMMRNQPRSPRSATLLAAVVALTMTLAPAAQTQIVPPNPDSVRQRFKTLVKQSVMP